MSGIRSLLPNQNDFDTKLENAPAENPYDIDITGIDKAELLAALYNNAGVYGAGLFSQKELGNEAGKMMTKEQAQEYIDNRGLSIDYLHGKRMKVNLQGDRFNARRYNDDGGPKAIMIVNALRKGASEEFLAAQQKRLDEAKKASEQTLEEYDRTCPLPTFYEFGPGNKK
jgi:hypothetical protein